MIAVAETVKAELSKKALSEANPLVVQAEQGAPVEEQADTLAEKLCNRTISAQENPTWERIRAIQHMLPIASRAKQFTSIFPNVA